MKQAEKIARLLERITVRCKGFERRRDSQGKIKPKEIACLAGFSYYPAQ